MPENIRVNPASVISYGNQATERFTEIQTSLKRLVDDVTNVHYYGPNAVAFKTNLGSMATTFANNVSTDMQNMAQAVRASTSNISNALGGARVEVAFTGGSVDAPAVQSVDFVDISTDALSELSSNIGTRFDEISAQLQRNLSDLHRTDWTGTAKNSAVSEVGSYTGTATDRCTATSADIKRVIDDQIETVLAADK